jgi:hypothetical protein
MPPGSQVEKAGEQDKNRRQQLTAAHHVCHRLHMKWVDGEDGRAQGGIDRGYELEEEQEPQKAGRRMEYDVHGMIRRRSVTPQCPLGGEAGDGNRSV